MAENVKPGMEFANWMSLPSISETLIKQGSGQGFSPLMALAGGALEKMGFGSDTSSKMKGPAIAGAAPSPNTPDYVPPVVAAPTDQSTPNGAPASMYQLAPPSVQGAPNAIDLWSNRFKFGGQ
tara:strand:- start:2870 stop:3238 length:369 start_codon:yes stop_codon:yes gene_type:complete